MTQVKPTGTPVFGTLGPAGTNHEMVTRNYLSARGLDEAAIVLFDDFGDGLRVMAEGGADFMVQAAVHAECAGIVAAAHFEHDIHVIDTFLSPSKELAILTRRDVAVPHTLALQPATERYANLDRWATHIPVASTVRIGEGLLAGEYDSGLTMLELAERYPEDLRIDVRLGTVDDPWLVFGKRSVCNGRLVAWPESPACEQFRRGRNVTGRSATAGAGTPGVGQIAGCECVESAVHRVTSPNANSKRILGQV